MRQGQERRAGSKIGAAAAGGRHGQGAGRGLAADRRLSGLAPGLARHPPQLLLTACGRNLQHPGCHRDLPAPGCVRGTCDWQPEQTPTRRAREHGYTRSQTHKTHKRKLLPAPFCALRSAGAAAQAPGARCSEAEQLRIWCQVGARCCAAGPLHRPQRMPQLPFPPRPLPMQRRGVEAQLAGPDLAGAPAGGRAAPGCGRHQRCIASSAPGWRCLQLQPLAGHSLPALRPQARGVARLLGRGAGVCAARRWEAGLRL
jgi:hypothetical protein